MLKWLPWKFFMRRLARAHGFLDPLSIMGALERFAQPSEVSTPIELLRAGLVFHARGLMNAKAIQHNLDWVWPFWVQRQFNPADKAFLPRAFSFSHVNLTHRNWTAVGLPGCNAYPLVDPRGLVTPFFDGWSLSGWLLGDDGQEMLPPMMPQVAQRLVLEPDSIAVETEYPCAFGFLKSRTEVIRLEGRPVCVIRYSAQMTQNGWLAIVFRPFNPEGVSFVHGITVAEDRKGWLIEKKVRIGFDLPADRCICSNYHEGDVHLRLRERGESLGCECKVGLVTAAALFKITPQQPREIAVSVDLTQDEDSVPIVPVEITSWAAELNNTCRLKIADKRMQFIYDAAVRSLILLSPQDVYPGPYTYKRFWFRDAALILNAMLSAGLLARSERVIDRFPERQTLEGFFHSQEGEWDSNGAALWIMNKYCRFAGAKPKKAWHHTVVQGARWIHGKRSRKGRALHSGLLPAGFSAEHLGNNDYYYWDDFWSVAGLRSAAEMCDGSGHERHSQRFNNEAGDLLDCIRVSLERSSDIRRHPGIPASPYRRMDAGAVGSVAAGYPLQLLPPDDPQLLATVDYLLKDCTFNGAFFQDMIHSGMNAYLTLHLAQVLLRAGDPRFLDLLNAVAALASPTGQWPEAIHPMTGGGCMGDGQHLWAAGEWIVMIRNMFLREEEDALILCAGIPSSWLNDGPIEFGPAPTAFGAVQLRLERQGESVVVSWNGQWRGTPPNLKFWLPGFEPRDTSGPEGEILLRRSAEGGPA